jgi:rRNA processing protein Krr1/Pno1
MAEGMSDRMYIYIYIILIIELYNYIYTSRWYVRNRVRIVGQGGDHSKKVISLSGGLVEHVGRLLGNVGKTCAV